MNRVSARAVTWVLVLVALAVTQVLQSHLPDPTGSSRPFDRNGKVGEKIALRSGDLEVTTVKGGTSAAIGSPHGFLSPGVVVVASFTWRARSERATLSAGELRASSGRTYIVSSVGLDRGRIDCGASSPGLLRQCSVLVEAPPDALEGATLVLRPTDDGRFDDEAVVDLGIDAATAARWAKTGAITSPAQHYAGQTP